MGGRVPWLAPRDSWILKGRAIGRALGGDRAGACSDFAAAHDARPDDAYAVLWTVGLGGDARLLESHAEKNNWRGNVARFYMGRISRDELLRIASTAPTEREKQEHLCEAHGYIGLLAERDGDDELASASYKACVATRVTTFVEYAWAEARLRDRH